MRNEPMRKLMFSIPGSLDERMRRMAFLLAKRPHKGTIGEYVQRAIMRCVEDDERIALSPELERLDAAFSHVPSAEDLHGRQVPAGPRTGNGLTPGRVVIRAGNCDPARWEHCMNRGVHEFECEPPISIGPNVCVRCGYERRAQDEPSAEWGPACSAFKPEHEALALQDAHKRAELAGSGT